MRKMKVLLLLLVSSSYCAGQEKMKVDLDATSGRTEPRVTSGEAIAFPRDDAHRNQVWRVDLSASVAKPAGSTMLEMQIVNISTVPQTLPKSQDGVHLVTDCPDNTVLTGAYSLGSKADNRYYRKLGIFYGCEARPATLVKLQPGEWVTYVTRVPTDLLPKQIRAQIRLVHVKFSPRPEGQHTEDFEDSTDEDSPWVQVPEPAAGP